MAQDDGNAMAKLDAIVQSMGEKRRPPVNEWDPPARGDSEMRIARDGTWYHQGAPIRRPAMVALFSGLLRREGDVYYLVTPVEKLAITVEDAPFLAVELEAVGSGRSQVLYFRTNVDDWVRADEAHPLRVETDDTTREARPYLTVRDGLEALIARSVFYRMADRAVSAPEEGGSRLGIWSAGSFFSLGEVGIDA